MRDAARLRTAVPALKETALRVAYVRSELTRLGPERAASALEPICAAAEQADPVAREVLGAVAPVLADPEAEPLVAALRAVANARALLALGRLLRRRVAIGSSPEPTPEPNERLLATSSSGRVLTLGERKALARRPSRAAFEKLLRDPHPLVIRNLLENPCVTEDDVVRLAARRPAFADVVAEIAKHPGWAARPRVRMAIVQNPGTPPKIAVPIVALLIRPELEQVIAAADVPAIVRAAATELLARRPPVADRDRGSIH